MFTVAEVLAPCKWEQPQTRGRDVLYTGRWRLCLEPGCELGGMYLGVEVDRGGPAWREEDAQGVMRTEGHAAYVRYEECRCCRGRGWQRETVDLGRFGYGFGVYYPELPAHFKRSEEP